MATLREQIRLANIKINNLMHEKRALERELDRQCYGFSQILIRLTESYPSKDIFEALKPQYEDDGNASKKREIV